MWNKFRKHSQYCAGNWGYKDCTLMAVVRIVPYTRPEVKRREIENTVVEQRGIHFFLFEKKGKALMSEMSLSTLSLDA